MKLPSPRFSLKSILVLVFLAAALLAGKQWWDAKVCREAAELWLQQCKDEYTTLNAYTIGISAESSPPANFTRYPKANQIIALRNIAANSKEPFDQIYAIRLLVARYPKLCLPAIREIFSSAELTEVKRVAALCLAASSSESNRPIFDQLLKHTDPIFRKIAIDGLGSLHSPCRGGPYRLGRRVESDPVVTLFDIAKSTLKPKPSKTKLPNGQPELEFEPKPNWLDHPEDLDQLLSLMCLSPTEAERDSAARAIVGVGPAGYNLRAAEWGVWINSEGSMELKKRIIDEIPEFVHRTVVDPDFLNGHHVVVPVTKPILHLTTNAPMAVQMKVGLRLGQPYFAYPKPDSVKASGRISKKVELDDLGLEYNNELQLLLDRTQHTKFLRSLVAADIKHFRSRNGAGAVYPTADGWPSKILRYERRFHPGGYEVCSLNYGGLIVTPELPKWAKVAKTTDERFGWWDELRKVPSSWVTSHGETERFLYYDGPTKLPAPFSVSCSDEQIQILPPETTLDLSALGEEEANTPLPGNRRLSTIVDPYEIFRDVPEHGLRDALYIDCRKNDTAVYVFPRWRAGAFYNFKDLQTPLERVDAEQKLMDLIQQCGLTREEAMGLVASWREELFERKGKRIVSFMSEDQYSNYCPIEILPVPTTMFRVGIILTPIEEATSDK